jgi:glucose-6-phosphate 1-dehydrogenase
MVIRIEPRPATRIRFLGLDPQSGHTRPYHLDRDLEEQVPELPTAYEVLLYAALHGEASDFAREDMVEESWRIVQPLLDDPPPVVPYSRGSWGPEEADRLTRGLGGWHEPWVPGQ